MSRRLVLAAVYILAIAAAIYLARMNADSLGPKNRMDKGVPGSTITYVPSATPQKQGSAPGNSAHESQGDARTRLNEEHKNRTAYSTNGPSGVDGSAKFDDDKADKAVFASGDIWDRMHKEFGYTHEARLRAVEEIRKLYGVSSVKLSKGDVQIDIVFKDGQRTTIEVGEPPKDGSEFGD